jgi:MFS family permease
MDQKGKPELNRHTDKCRISLTQGAFVLISGRLGSIYGYQRVSLLGGLLFTILSLANGFAKSYDSFIAVRALTGVGGGIFMPNAVALITTMVPPGKLRNIFMGFFAASPPIGGLLGAVMAGVFTRWANWTWMFVLM